ncbi:MAG: response regulator [Candidatus Omnitrophota bacterium]
MSDKKKIMIVDDDVEFVEELKDLLDSSGYLTAIYHNGESALKDAPTFKPDVILLDLKMEGKSGFEVANDFRLLYETSKTPIIAITGCYTEKSHTMLINICGMQYRLVKPFNPLDVISKIESLMQE